MQRAWHAKITLFGKGHATPTPNQMRDPENEATWWFGCSGSCIGIGRVGGVSGSGRD